MIINYYKIIKNYYKKIFQMVSKSENYAVLSFPTYLAMKNTIITDGAEGKYDTITVDS